MPFVPFHEKTPDPNTRVWVRIIGLVDSLVLANQDQLKDWQKHFSEVNEWLDESAKPEIVAAPLEFEVWDDREGFPIYRSEDAFCNTYKVTSHYDGTFTYCAINKKQIDCASVDEGRVKCQEAANALIQKIAFLKY